MTSSSPTLFISSRETPEETQSSLLKLQQQKVSSCAGSTTPDSPRDLMGELNEATTVVDKDKETRLRDPALLSVLETPTLETEMSSSNISLADSSITTDIVFTHPTTPTKPSQKTRTSTKTSPPWQPRSIADLVRHDLPSANIHVVTAALQQITLDCWDDAAIRSTVVRCGGLLAVVQAMETHSSNTVVQVAACQALTKLALDADNEVALAELGGIDAILSALMTHFECPDVQTAAWQALQNGTCQAALQRLSLDTAGGMQVLLHAFQQHAPHNATAACAAAATVANLCVANPTRTSRVVQANGIVLLAQQLQHHWGDDEARTDLAQSLERLCEGIAGRGPCPRHDADDEE